MKSIYLDYAATTPVDPRVAEKMCTYLTAEGEFGNPASLHVYGKTARNAVEEARAQVAYLIEAEPSEIIWTSGATESNNLAIKGAAQLYQQKGKHIVTLKSEHKAVLDTCQHLEKKGYNVTYLQPLMNGKIDLAAFQSALRADTILVSIMHVNNETGVIQDLSAIANITSSQGILLHVDAAQSAAKTAISVQDIPIDLLSLRAHNMYGPKGIGALYVRKKPRVRVEPLLHGGGHEQGMRSGTLATHQIVGMGEASMIATHHEEEVKQIQFLRDRLLRGLSSIPVMRLNSELKYCVPHILNFRFENMIADAILEQLPFLAVSTGSACLGKGTEGSYVLRSMGYTSDQAKSALRFSLGRFTTEQEIDVVVSGIKTLFARETIF
jgi:cysteine desulfurase